MRQEEINNEQLYSAVCAVISLPTAARPVNTSSLSMSAVRQNVSTRNERFPPSLYTSTQPLLAWKSSAVLSPVIKAKYAPVVCLTVLSQSVTTHLLL